MEFFVLKFHEVNAIKVHFRLRTIFGRMESEAKSLKPSIATGHEKKNMSSISVGPPELIEKKENWLQTL